MRRRSVFQKYPGGCDAGFQAGHEFLIASTEISERMLFRRNDIRVRERGEQAKKKCQTKSAPAMCFGGEKEMLLNVAATVHKRGETYGSGRQPPAWLSSNACKQKGGNNPLNLH